jgi:hypothetical protein
LITIKSKNEEKHWKKEKTVYQKEILFSPKIIKRYELNLRVRETHLTKGLLIGRQKTIIEFMNIGHHSDTIGLDPKKDYLMFEIFFENKEKEVIFQEFQSALSLLAFLGGLWKGLNVLFLLVVYPVGEVSYYKKLINSMFSVCLNMTDLNHAMYVNGVLSKNPENDESDEGSENIKGKEKISEDEKKSYVNAEKMKEIFDQIGKKNLNLRTRRRKGFMLKMPPNVKKMYSQQKGLLDQISSQDLSKVNLNN